MIKKFTQQNFHRLCDEVAGLDDDLAMIIQTHGYAPMWTRPNTFETLVHIILEQQVSLASALAALNQLRGRLGEKGGLGEKVGPGEPGEVSPAPFLALTDEELRACYFSRQKAVYARGLATELLSGRLDLLSLEDLPDEAVRTRLIALKGIGNWTIDVYLMFVLQRTDIFPVGDLAAVNALLRVKKLSRDTSKERLLQVAARWQPNRTIATMLLWHLYLSSPVRGWD